MCTLPRRQIFQFASEISLLRARIMAFSFHMVPQHYPQAEAYPKKLRWRHLKWYYLALSFLHLVQTFKLLQSLFTYVFVVLCWNSEFQRKYFLRPCLPEHSQQSYTATQPWFIKGIWPSTEACCLSGAAKKVLNNISVWNIRTNLTVTLPRK